MVLLYAMNRDILYLILLAIPFMLPTPKNNSCNNYWSYFNIYFSENCYHNPDIYSNVTEIIQRHIGSVEEHQIQTDDGFILRLFRIPRSNPKGVVLLIHPGLGDSRSFLSQYNESLAFVFWRAGYDVWLNNHRGNKFAYRHAIFTPDDPEFWDHSFHEMGYYDLSATVGYIYERTNRTKVICLGYSLGGTTNSVYGSTRPEEAQKYVKIFVNVGSVAFMRYLTTYARYSLYLMHLARYFGMQTIGGDVWYQNIFIGLGIFSPFKKLVPYAATWLTGGSSEEFDPNLANAYLGQLGSSASLKAVDHYFQIYSSKGDFQMYDHGKEKNLLVYGTEKPLVYPLENITVPFLLVYSLDDSCSYFKDNELFYERLPEVAKTHGRIVVPGFNHMDFIYGKHRFEKVFAKILKILDDL